VNSASNDDGWVTLDSGRRVRRTCLAAYEEIRDSGLLSKRRWETYQALALYGPLTRNEVDAQLAPGQPNASFSRRLCELERLGVISRADVRVCRVTGKNCDTWDITDNTPSREAPVPRRAVKVTGEKLEAVLAVLREYMAGGYCRCKLTQADLFDRHQKCLYCRALDALES